MRHILAFVLSLLPAALGAQDMTITAHGTRGPQVWHLSCNGQSCRASSHGMGLSLDPWGQVLLTLDVPQGARVSLSDGIGTLDMPNLFLGPLDSRDIAQLSLPGRTIVIERNWRVIHSVPLNGFADVITFLNRRAGVEAEAPPPALAHLAEAHAAALEPNWQVVPQTKPQIEFAIRAQGGTGVTMPDRASAAAE
ncbi:hypothetical protein IV417_04860 [Alphaproteobacteria bacterium KMM 3653]|uniref:DUF2330 domain-containing protein n=1 Tax=Harenicola maris TaxID=2841044 RepID=A0AAP2CQI9_9RHOB|nr:hypothetical protein [Harenicola maris]